MQQMNIVFTGHVDHGKSTVVGRLLADTGSLPEGKLEQVRAACEKKSRPFEYAFLIDALKDEQAQGITIDSARVFFKTNKRNYIIIDAPGHIEFLKNMVTGASRAEAAFLVIDADEGVQENSRRHGYMLSMLGVKQMIVLVNKMDLAGYSEEVFNSIRDEYSSFLNSIFVKPDCFIPISAIDGDNIASLSPKMGWYEGRTVLEGVDAFDKEAPVGSLPFRMPVQDVYKFTKNGDSRRIVSGEISAGRVKTGDTLVFYPSGKRSKINSIETFNTKPRRKLSAGRHAGFTLREQIYIKRGELAVIAGEREPEVSSRIRVSLFWLGQNPMVSGREYRFKLGTSAIPVRLESIEKLIDASTLGSSGSPAQVNRHDVAECVLKLNRAAAFDTVDSMPSTSRFVIVDEYEIAGGGIIREALDDSQAHMREHVWERTEKWTRSRIPPERRSEKYKQRPSLIIITGRKDCGKKVVARNLEQLLFDDGHFVYFVGIGGLLYGIGSDIKNSDAAELYQPGRLIGEVAYLMISAGLILVLTAVDLSQKDLEELRLVFNSSSIEIVQVAEPNTDIEYSLQVGAGEPEKAALAIKDHLQTRGYIFNPWKN